MNTQSGTSGTFSGVQLITYTFLGTLALLGATIGFAYVDLGPMNLPVALLFAALKALLIALVFMELRQSIAPVKLVVVTILIWSVLFAALSSADYLSRTWPVNPGMTDEAPYSSDLTPRKANQE